MDTNICIVDYFEDLEDPRVFTLNKRHQLLDIVTISILAVLSGAEGWADIFTWAQAREAWLSTFLKLPFGLPSKDCIRRVISRIKPEQFRTCFLNWTSALCEATDGQIIAIDGKTLRHSFDNRSGKKALHLVSAWAFENHLLLGQEAVDQKSNEITAIPKLLEILELTGAIVTIDAMGCQREIVRQIHEGGGDYVIGLKGNQPQLHEAAKDEFSKHMENDFADVDCRQHQTSEKAHGRVEERTYYQMKLPADFPNRDEWAGLETIGMVVNHTVCNGVFSDDVRYYISSLPLGVEKFAASVRGHWGIENGLHWTLDVTFDEDQSRISKDHGSENFGLLRRIALSVLKRHQGDKKSVRQRRLRSGWEGDYLLEILGKAAAS
jgi:predicted transposase YbfD/YdcC